MPFGNIAKIRPLLDLGPLGMLIWCGLCSRHSSDRATWYVHRTGRGAKVAFISESRFSQFHCRVCYGNFSDHKRTQRKHTVWSTECGGYAGTPPTPHPCPHREIPTIQPSYFFPNATMRTQSHAVAAPGFEPGCRRDPLAAARRAPSAPRAARCSAAAMRAAAPPAAPPCSPLPRSPPHPSPEATHPTPRPPTLLRPRLPSRPPVAAALPLLRRAVEHLPPTRTHVWSGGGHALRGGWKRGAAYLDEQFNDLLRSATSAESPQMIADGRGRSPLETDPGRRSDHGLPAVQMPPR